MKAISKQERKTIKSLKDSEINLGNVNNRTENIAIPLFKDYQLLQLRGIEATS